MNMCKIETVCRPSAATRRSSILAHHIALALVVNAASGAYANAQTADPRAPFASEGILEEVIVTAQKRAQGVQDVPMSVFAVTGEALEDIGIRGVEQLDQIAAGVTVAAANPGALNITMRGISNLGGGLLTGPSVGYYLDEAPLSSFSLLMPEVAFWDAERIEVLRGPQGTLFGEGSMGGTIRVISNKPDPNSFATSLKADWASVSDGDDGFTGRVMVNIPLLADTLALRATGSYQDLVGWVDVPDLGLEDVNDGEQQDARVALRWTPGDRFTLDLSYAYQSLDSEEFFATSPGVYRPSELDPEMQAVVARSPRESEYDLANVTATYDFGFATLVAVASWFDQERSQATDLTPTTTKFFGPLGAGATATQVVNELSVDASTQEIRLVSNGDRTFNWTIGAYHKEDDRVNGGNGFIISLPAFGLVDDQALTTVAASVDAWAAFADVEYKLTDSFAVQAGVRYYDGDNEQLVRFDTTSLIFGTIAGVEQPSGASYTHTSPKFGLSWSATEDLLFYARYAAGFRDGGSNYQAPGYPEIVAGFDPEEVDSYEIGLKSQPLPWMTINASVYQNEWTDLQLPFVTTDGLFAYIENAGKAKSTGGEVEIAAQPTSGLRLGLNLAYVDAEIDEDVFNALGLQIATRGNEIPYSPQFQAAASASYFFPITASLSGNVSANYSYRDRTYSTADNDTVLRNDSLELLYLRFGVSGSNWGAAVYVNNATDADATLSRSLFAGAAVAYGTYVQPRTVGVELTASF